MNPAPRVVGCALVGISTLWAAAWVTGAKAESSAARIEPAECVQLTYRAPPECPSRGSIVQRAATMVRNTPKTPILAKATIERRGRYVLWLELEGGRRQVTSDSCDALAETLTVILALAIDPQARVEPSAPAAAEPAVPDPSASVTAENGANAASAASANVAAAESSANAPTASADVAGNVPPPSGADSASAPAASAPSASATAEPDVPAPEPPQDVVATDRLKEENVTTGSESPSAPARFGFATSALFWTEYGMLPKASFGPNVGFWIEGERWSYSVAAEWLAPQRTELSPQRGGNISFLGGKGLVCLQPSRGARLLLCLGAEAGDLMGQGKGVPASKLGHGLWLAGVSALVYRPSLWSRLGAEVRVEGAFAALWPEFGFTGNDWRFEPSRGSLRVASGFSWSL